MTMTPPLGRLPPLFSVSLENHKDYLVDGGSQYSRDHHHCDEDEADEDGADETDETDETDDDTQFPSWWEKA